MPFVPKGRSLQRGEFYIPRLGHLDAPEPLPGTISRFVDRLRLLFDAEIYVPKQLDLNVLKDFSDDIHILVRAQTTDDWIFERFAPTCASCMSIDLTGATISDPRLAEYNLRLDEKLASLVRQEAPLYGNTRVHTPRHNRMVHWLFVPMSNTGMAITHCLIMLAYKGGKQHGNSQATTAVG
jgi:hypothetical protein